MSSCRWKQRLESLCDRRGTRRGSSSSRAAGRRRAYAVSGSLNTLARSRSTCCLLVGLALVAAPARTTIGGRPRRPTSSSPSAGFRTAQADTAGSRRTSTARPGLQASLQTARSGQDPAAPSSRPERPRRTLPALPRPLPLARPPPCAVRLPPISPLCLVHSAVPAL